MLDVQQVNPSLGYITELRDHAFLAVSDWHMPEQPSDCSELWHNIQIPDSLGL